LAMGQDHLVEAEASMILAKCRERGCYCGTT
jgi:hypothetical protein